MTWAHTDSLYAEVVYLVIINDYSDYIVPTKVDSVWRKWEEAAARVHLLNEKFYTDHYSDQHAFYHLMKVNTSIDQGVC